MGLDQAKVALVPNLGHRLADDDLELLLFVVPVAQVAAVDADDDRPLRHGQLLSAGGVAFNEAGLLIVEFLSKCHLVRWLRMVAALVSTGSTSFSTPAVRP